MAYAQVGRTGKAAAEIDQLLAIAPACGSHVIADLQKRNVHPHVIQTVVDGLNDPGLVVDGSAPDEGSRASAAERS